MRQRGIDKMSLCYDFQKWVMISLSSVVITLVIGLVSLAYAYIDTETYTSDPDLVNNITQVNYWEKLVNYCFDHADRPNPLQDLRDKGFSVIGTDCKQVNQLYDGQLSSVNRMIADYNKKLADYKKSHFCEFVPDPNSYPDCRGE
jgi:hypothetical protein